MNEPGTSGLSNNKLTLLAIGLARSKKMKDGTTNGAYITYDDARKIYSSKEATIGALNSLRMNRYIRIHAETCGVFIILKAPPKAYDYTESIIKERKAINYEREKAISH